MTTLKFKAAVDLASELLQGAGMNVDDANVRLGLALAALLLPLYVGVVK